MKKYQKFLSMVLFIGLFPAVANADPKSDVNSYETAFNNGDEINGARLLKEALKNAQSLPIGNPYLAKISFDNAYYFNQIGEYKVAYDAVEITKKSFDANPKLQAGSNSDDFSLLYSYLKYVVGSNNDNIKNNIADLNNASLKLLNVPQSDTLLLSANKALDDYYFLMLQWRDMIDINSRQELVLKNVTDITPEQKKNFEINYELRNGQARFLRAINNVKSPGLGSKIDVNKQSGWEDAYISLLQARMSYGSPQTYSDKDAAEIESWIGMVESYAISFFNVDYTSKKIAKIKKSMNYDYSNYIAKDLYKECLGAFYTKTNFVANDATTGKYNFSIATIAYDLDKNLKPYNIRIINSYPDEYVAKNAVSNVKTATYTYDGETPPDKCYKNNIIKINYYIDNRN